MGNGGNGEQAGSLFYGEWGIVVFKFLQILKEAFFRGQETRFFQKTRFLRYR